MFSFGKVCNKWVSGEHKVAAFAHCSLLYMVDMRGSSKLPKHSILHGEEQATDISSPSKTYT